MIIFEAKNNSPIENEKISIRLLKNKKIQIESFYNDRADGKDIYESDEAWEIGRRWCQKHDGNIIVKTDLFYFTPQWKKRQPEWLILMITAEEKFKLPFFTGAPITKFPTGWKYSKWDFSDPEKFFRRKLDTDFFKLLKWFKQTGKTEVDLLALV